MKDMAWVFTVGIEKVEVDRVVRGLYQDRVSGMEVICIFWLPSWILFRNIPAGMLSEYA